MAEHDYSAALSLVNDMYSQFAQLGRVICNAYVDKRISTLEGLSISLRATTVAAAITTLVQEADPALMQDVLYTLEHGRLTLSE